MDTSYQDYIMIIVNTLTRSTINGDNDMPTWADRDHNPTNEVRSVVGNTSLLQKYANVKRAVRANFPIIAAAIDTAAISTERSEKSKVSVTSRKKSSPAHGILNTYYYFAKQLCLYAGIVWLFIFQWMKLKSLTELCPHFTRGDNCFKIHLGIYCKLN